MAGRPMPTSGWSHPSRLAVEGSEYGQGQISLMPLSSWVTLGKLLMSCPPVIHTHLGLQIVALCGNRVSADVLT